MDAQSPTAPEAESPGEAAVGPGVGLVTWLAARAQTDPTALAYTHLRDGESDADTIDFAQLSVRTAAVARALVARGLAGRPVVLALPTGLDYVVALLGCMRAGAIAVPCMPATQGAGRQRLAGIVAACRAEVAIVDEAFRRRLAELPVAMLTVAELAASSGAGHGFVDAPFDPKAPALLQYTSGTTAVPKGVVVTHDNLAHNLRQMCFTGPIPGVSWLPPHHDMGLIGGVLHGIARGGHTVLLSPMHFVQRPIRWLRAITKYGAVGSPGPDFAYRLCVERITDADLQGIDLSTWRYAFTGAEPISLRTLEAFADRFARVGFRREAFLPCYGLAEATLMVTRGELGAPPRAIVVDAAALHEGRVREGSGTRARTLVSSGRAIEDTSVVVVDTQGRPQPDDAIGEIWVRGPSVAPRYHDDPEATAATFGGELGDHGRGFLRTGDRGFLRDGHLYVTDRIKDLVIVRGRNVSPSGIEAATRAADPRLARTVIAAFGHAGADRESLVVAIEQIRELRDVDVDALVRRVGDAVAAQEGVRPDRVVLVKPGRVPRTTSGKVQRHACSAALLPGDDAAGIDGGAAA